MTIETDLYSTLSNAAGVTSITDRISFWPVAENTALPYVVLRMITGTRLDTLNAVGDQARKLMQVTAWADSYSGSKALAAAVDSALQSTGRLEFEIDAYDEETKSWGVHQDWSFVAT